MFCKLHCIESASSGMCSNGLKHCVLPGNQKYDKNMTWFCRYTKSAQKKSGTGFLCSHLSFTHIYVHVLHSDSKFLNPLSNFHVYKASAAIKSFRLSSLLVSTLLVSSSLLLSSSSSFRYWSPLHSFCPLLLSSLSSPLLLLVTFPLSCPFLSLLFSSPSLF